MYRKWSTQRGFTLVELMVVLSIISLMSSIVLASLSTARARAADAAIRTDLNNIRSFSQIYFSNLGQYSTAGASIGLSSTCNSISPQTPVTNITNDVAFQEIIDDAVLKNGGLAAKCVATPTYFVVAVRLKSDATRAWCVDSSGGSRLLTIWARFTNGDTDCAQAAS